MKLRRILYWVTTLLLTALLCFSVYMYFFNHEAIQQAFTNLGYPTYLIYPLAIAKVLGIIVILTNLKIWKEWAYAGFFFNFLLAFFAHQQVGDGEQGGAAMAIFFLLASYFLGKQVRP